MAVLEVGARFAACFLLVWFPFAFRNGQSAGARSSLALGFIACGFGILGDLKDVNQGAFIAAIILGSAAMGVSVLSRITNRGTVSPATLEPVVALAIGFFAGQGTVLLAAALALCALLIREKGAGKAGWLAGSAGGSYVLHIKAQSIRGVIGRIEAVLERLGLRPSTMAVQHDGHEKELSITTEFTLPPGVEVNTLIAALQEIEGIIQFALE
jgi:hypothetical protein